MIELDNSSIKVYQEADGTIWLHLGKLLSFNLTEFANGRGPVWLFQFQRWAKALTKKAA